MLTTREARKKGSTSRLNLAFGLTSVGSPQQQQQQQQLTHSSWFTAVLYGKLANYQPVVSEFFCRKTISCSPNGKQQIIFMWTWTRHIQKRREKCGIAPHHSHGAMESLVCRGFAYSPSSLVSFAHLGNTCCFSGNCLRPRLASGGSTAATVCMSWRSILECRGQHCMDGCNWAKEGALLDLMPDKWCKEERKRIELFNLSCECSSG